MLEKCPTNEKLENFKEGLKIAADELILNTFPRKVFECDEILRGENFQLSRINDFRVDINIPMPDGCVTNDVNNEENSHSNGPKKRKMEKLDVDTTKILAFVNGLSPCNRKILELIDIVKPIVREIVENVNKVKMWLLLLIPRIEDGNNFGVAIQEETLGEVRAVESEAAAFLDQISRYLFTRGKLVSRIAKYPHVEDYREAIVDLDEKEFLNLRLVLIEVRNHYTVIHDMVTKNYEKIKKPRNSNTEHLY
uniref:Proteasome activator complex subunit 3 n=1 Tax=Romanomermis culicivorax TaxID=13658 RepID=A0A915IQA8_ROMCU